MTTDLYSTVFFQDGEQLTHDDLNNVQRFPRAQLADQVLEKRIGSLSLTGTDPEFGGQNGANAPASRAYAIGAGAAYLRPGSANQKIQVAPGTLLQKIGNADGADATLVAYTFAGTEEWTLTNGDATNPRVDLLQMKLEYITDTLASVDFQDQTTRANTTTPNTATRRRVQCTLSVKAGTPGASPTIPEPDAGFVPVGSVTVGNGWTTGGNAPIFGTDTTAANNAVVHDQRMPINVRGFRVDPVMFKLKTAWALESANSAVASSSGTNELYVPCPMGIGRLVGVAIWHASASAGLGTIALMKNVPAGTISSSSDAQNAANLTAGSLSRNTIADDATLTRDYTVMFYTFEATHAPSAGPTISQSSTTKIGVPLWTNGDRCPRPKVGMSIPAMDLLLLKIQNATSGHRIGYVTFFVAG